MPTNHHVTVTLPDDKATRARAVCPQPKAEHSRPHSANMDIVSSEWIEQDWHLPLSPARPSFFTILGYGDMDDQWLLRGTFTREQDNA